MSRISFPCVVSVSKNDIQWKYILYCRKQFWLTWSWVAVHDLTICFNIEARHHPPVIVIRLELQWRYIYFYFNFNTHIIFILLVPLTRTSPCFCVYHIPGNNMIVRKPWVHTLSVIYRFFLPWSWWHHQMEPFFASLGLCAKIHRSPVNSPSQRSVTRGFDVFFDLHLNKRLGKQSWGWWFETPSRLLWRHCNDRISRHSMTKMRLTPSILISGIYHVSNRVIKHITCNQLWHSVGVIPQEPLICAAPQQMCTDVNISRMVQKTTYLKYSLAG